MSTVHIEGGLTGVSFSLNLPITEGQYLGEVRPRVGRGRWRRVKATLREFFGGPVPPQEMWCADDLANYRGFSKRDARKYMGRGRQRSPSAKERRRARRNIGECSACGRRYRLNAPRCPRCGEVEIPF